MAPRDLATRIRRAREIAGLSQRQVAEAIGAGVRSVGRWERGETVPRNKIGPLEQLLGVDLTANGVPQPYADLDNPAERAIWSMTRYSEEERRALIDALRADARRQNTG